MIWKKIGIVLLLAVCSGCGNKAIYLASGTTCVLEKSVTVQASVPDSTGKLIPNTIITLAPGSKIQGK